MISCNISSCSKKEDRNQNFIPPINIENISELSDDPEILDFVMRSVNSVNEYSDNIEIVALNGDRVININQDSLTVLEGLEITKIMIGFYSNCTNFQNTIDDFDAFIIEQKSNGSINQSQVAQLIAVSDMYKDRVEVLNNKYRVFYKR